MLISKYICTELIIILKTYNMRMIVMFRLELDTILYIVIIQPIENKLDINSFMINLKKGKLYIKLSLYMKK